MLCESSSSGTQLNTSEQLPNFAALIDPLVDSRHLVSNTEVIHLGKALCRTAETRGCSMDEKPVFVYVDHN
jgi:hypothetical protein